MTKYHKLGGLNNENVSSHSPGGQNSRVEVSSGVTLSEAVACLSPSFGRCLVLLALQARQCDPSLHLHMVHSVSVSLSVSVFRVPPCFKDVRYFGLWVHTQDLFLT